MKIGANIGSGQRPFTSNDEVRWLNVDKVTRDGMPIPDVIRDGVDYLSDYHAGLRIRGESSGGFDYIVLHHVLEHYGCGEGVNLLMASYNALASGGSLLVFVPDLRALAQRWLLGKLDTETYMINLYGAYMGSDEDRHKFGFDAQSLREQLSDYRLPWASVKPFDWREIPGMDAARDWWVLAMECVK